MPAESTLYLDHAATTPVAEEVLEAMLPYFREHFGNASSRSHPLGWVAEKAVSKAREQVAELIAASPEQITFCSGATEAINLAIKGIAWRWRPYGRHIITMSSEHSAVLDTCQWLEEQGFEVSYLDPGPDGRLDLEHLKETIRPDTILCSIMWANNETGVLQDMAGIGQICREKEIVLFSDATQAAGKIELSPEALGIDSICLSAHKFYGPKGVGALYLGGRLRKGILSPLQHGGGHESGLRSGTLNVPGIVGLGAASVLAKAEMQMQGERLNGLRQDMEAQLCAALPQTLIQGATAPRLPHISNVSFRFTEAEALLSTFKRSLALSTGSACASMSLGPSHVLLSMGLSAEDAKAAVRISMGRDTSAEDVQTAVRKLIAGVEKLRTESPAWELFEEGLLD